MNAYGCLSTGDFVGMLEVVMNSRTIAEIQGMCRHTERVYIIATRWCARCHG
jgi:hypothetical protein